MNTYFENFSQDYSKYCSIYNILGHDEIIPNISGDFVECLASFIEVLKMRPKEKYMEVYLNKVVLGIYNSMNMNQYNLSHYFLGGPLKKMCDSRSFGEMKKAWANSMAELSGKFNLHSKTLALVEKLITT
jgi:hypothetical protein